MTTVSLKLEDELLARVDSLASKKEISRSEAIRQALAEYVAGAQAQYTGIPRELKDRVEFIKLLVLEGGPDKDWELVQKEVSSLWITLQ